MKTGQRVHVLELNISCGDEGTGETVAGGLQGNLETGGEGKISSVARIGKGPRSTE